MQPQLHALFDWSISGMKAQEWDKNRIENTVFFNLSHNNGNKYHDFHKKDVTLKMNTKITYADITALLALINEIHLHFNHV